MTQFAPKHLSEKLQAAGCVKAGDDWSLLDFLGPSEQSRTNAVKWWGGKNINGGPADFEFWEESRFHLVNVSYITSDAEAWEYVERTGVSNG